ncbi:MAG: hypothetical protein IJ069_13510 [Prevotella sp.]|nr:hypothetical protein [Prevotella sp.]
MSDIEEFDSESIPVSFCLDEVRSCPEYRDAMPLERLLSRYYCMQGNVRLSMLVSEVIRRHFTPPERFQRSILSDDEAREVLCGLIKTGMIDGQYQFVAVYRVLSDFCNFPKEITSFCHKIIGLALELKGEPLEYKSLYQSVQKGINAHPALPMSYKRWTEYQIKDGERASTFLRQKAVADRLMEILRKRKILLSK